MRGRKGDRVECLIEEERERTRKGRREGKGRRRGVGVGGGIGGGKEGGEGGGGKGGVGSKTEWIAWLKRRGWRVEKPDKVGCTS